MLKNLKPEVYSLLSGDVTLTAAAKGGIYADYSPDSGTYPVVVYSEISNVPHFHADNQEQMSRIIMQVSVMVDNGSTSTIAARIDELMTGGGFTRQSSADLVDGIIKIKSMRYRKEV